MTLIAVLLTEFKIRIPARDWSRWDHVTSLWQHISDTERKMDPEIRAREERNLAKSRIENGISLFPFPFSSFSQRNRNLLPSAIKCEFHCRVRKLLPSVLFFFHSFIFLSLVYSILNRSGSFFRARSRLPSSNLGCIAFGPFRRQSIPRPPPPFFLFFILKDDSSQNVLSDE